MYFVGAPQQGFQIPTSVVLTSRGLLIDVALVPQHTVALTTDEVITWGRNDQGQCGQGERAEVTWVKPRFIRMLSRVLVTQVVCGSHHTLCVTATSQASRQARCTQAVTYHLDCVFPQPVNLV
jgi:alpha-tubulin suppressor-like RCC1 family protein